MDTTVGADTLEELSRDPYPVYRRLREEGACVWLDAANRYGCRDGRTSWGWTSCLASPRARSPPS